MVTREYGPKFTKKATADKQRQCRGRGWFLLGKHPAQKIPHEPDSGSDAASAVHKLNEAIAPYCHPLTRQGFPEEAHKPTGRVLARME